MYGDKYHEAKYAAQALHRLKDEYFCLIGVDEIVFDQVFVTTPKEGITFHPKKPVNLDLEDIGEALRSTGIPQDQLLSIVDCMIMYN